MKNLLIRSLSGLVFVILVIGSIWLGKWTFILTSSFFAFVCLYEFLDLSNKKDVKSLKYITLFFGMSIYTLIVSVAYAFIGLKFALLIFPILFLLPIIELYRNKENPIQNIANSIFSIVYIILPFGLLHFIFNSGSGIEGKLLVTVFYSLIWLNDSGAYLVGSAMGKNRLFERISPKKSWEGSIGGGIFVIISTIILANYFTILSLWEWIGLGILISILANVGDLIESMFKRSMDVKDTGKIMPGHGGLLDRFDAAIFAVPFVLIYLKFLIG